MSLNIKKLRNQLELDEGVIYGIYLDNLGLLTCGIGHLITKEDIEYKLPAGTKISNDRVEELFKKDIKGVIDDCNRLFCCFNHYQEELKQILANMMFNLGYNRLSKFKKFIAAIKKADFKSAAIEMEDSLWWNQVGNRAKRLQGRILNL